MEIHDPILHQKLIEMCDCYLGTDYSSTLRTIGGAAVATEEEALRYLALALLSGLTEKAGRLSIKRKKGKVSVCLKGAGGKIALPPPSGPLFDRIVSVLRGILHLDDDKGAMPLALGLKNDQVELHVKVERKGDDEKIKLRFPDLG